MIKGIVTYINRYINFNRPIFEFENYLGNGSCLETRLLTEGQT
jgi:hypothetical protein